MRLVRFLDPMYSDRGERLRSKAAAALAHLATDNEANAQAILKLGVPAVVRYIVTCDNTHCCARGVDLLVCGLFSKALQAA